MRAARLQLRNDIARLAKKMSRSEAASIAGKASAAARRAKGGGGAPHQSATAEEATQRANAYIAAHPDQFRAKGAKGKGKAKGTGKGTKAKGAGKGKDPAAAKAKAEREKERQSDRAQRAKEHEEDRAQRAQDRAARAKEHQEDRAQRQQEREQKAKEHTEDRATRAKQQAAKQKQQQSKQKAGGSKGAAPKEPKHTEPIAPPMATAAAADLSSGNPLEPAQEAALITNGLARKTKDGLVLTSTGLRAAAQAEKMAKVQGNIRKVFEQTGLFKRDIPTKTRAKMDDSSFVFSDTRSFPISRPEDVMAAVRSWGRYKGAHSFADFKRNLTRIARKKGFALPDAWKEDATQKRAAALALEAEMLAKANMAELAGNALIALQKLL